MKILKEALIGKKSIDKFERGLVPIKNFSYKDLLVPGNIIFIDSNFGLHHGIVLSIEQSHNIFFINEIAILTCNEHGNLTYWVPTAFKNNFPTDKEEDTKIVNIYKGPNTSKCTNSTDFKKLYELYNLRYIK